MPYYWFDLPQWYKTYQADSRTESLRLWRFSHRSKVQWLDERALTYQLTRVRLIHYLRACQALNVLMRDCKQRLNKDIFVEMSPGVVYDVWRVYQHSQNLDLICELLKKYSAHELSSAQIKQYLKNQD